MSSPRGKREEDFELAVCSSESRVTVALLYYYCLSVHVRYDLIS